MMDILEFFLEMLGWLAFVLVLFGVICLIGLVGAMTLHSTGVAP